MSDVADFVRRQLGHKPKDLGLFELALTHSSVAGGQDWVTYHADNARVAGGQSYERL